MGIRKYGSSDDVKIAQESAESREIVAKIMDLQPSQRLIRFVLHDLSMNLENNDHMRRILSLLSDLADDDVSNINNSNLLI